MHVVWLRCNFTGIQQRRATLSCVINILFSLYLYSYACADNRYPTCSLLCVSSEIWIKKYEIWLVLQFLNICESSASNLFLLWFRMLLFYTICCLHTCPKILIICTLALFFCHFFKYLLFKFVNCVVYVIFTILL